MQEIPYNVTNTFMEKIRLDFLFILVPCNILWCIIFCLYCLIVNYVFSLEYYNPLQIFTFHTCLSFGRFLTFEFLWRFRIGSIEASVRMTSAASEQNFVYVAENKRSWSALKMYCFCWLLAFTICTKWCVRDVIALLIISVHLLNASLQ